MSIAPENSSKSPQVRLKENLLLGLLALTPMALTLWVLLSIIGSMDDFMIGLLPARLEPTKIFGFNIPGLGIIFTLLLVLAAGTLARTFWGPMLESVWDSLFMRIPFVGGLYKTARQVSNVFFSNDATRAFKKVVLVPFPSSASKAFAFVTGHPDSEHTAVFIPTAPNPTGGYVLIYPNSSIQASELSVESALKIILSCGAIPSDERAPESRLPLKKGGT